MMSMIWVKPSDRGPRLRLPLALRMVLWRVRQVLRYLAEDAAGAVTDLGFEIRDRGRVMRRWWSDYRATKV